MRDKIFKFKTFVFLSLLVIASTNIQAQKTKVRNGYYYLDFPVSDIFNTAFDIPNGNNDPRPVASVSEEITTDDLDVRIGATKQTSKSIASNNSNYLLNTWSHVSGIFVSFELYKVKHTLLKNASWSKFQDQAYHVIEGLSADSAIIKIYKNKGDTVGSGMIQKIVDLFVKPTTAVGKILSLLGNPDSTSQKQNELVKIQPGSKDTVTLLLTDNKVYFAVRYAKINEAQTSKIFSLFKGRVIAPPDCAPKMQKNPPEKIESILGEKQKTFNILGADCSINNYMVRANFINDFPDGGTFYIIKENKGSLAQNSKSNKILKDTIYISDPINFADNYYNINYSLSHPFVANEVAQKSGAKNILVLCDVEFNFDPKTRKMTVFNYNSNDKYYHTCVYQMTADVTFFPK